jgi:6-phosphogluconolactonase
MAIQWSSYPSAKAAAETCADHIVAALAGKDKATLAISGGTGPRPMFERLAGARLAWDRIHVFWVDERAVPPNHPESNYRVAAECFLTPAHVPARNIHRIHAELAPEVAAHRYVEDIQAFFGLKRGEMPHFDVIHRGMGPDGHTASLFPGEPLIDDRDGIAAAIHVEKLGRWRITLLPEPLLAAGRTAMLVTGADKAGAVRAAFAEPYNPKKIPAQLASRETVWFLDEAAAGPARG